MRYIVVGLIMLCLGLQYKIWFGDNSVSKWLQAEHKLKLRTEENRKLEARNQAVQAEVEDLKSGEEALEERARYELGMVKEDETYYHFAN